MYCYHATFNADKKIITTDDKDTLYDVVRHESCYSTSHCAVVRCWIWKLAECQWRYPLPDKCKLHIVVKGGHH